MKTLLIGLAIILAVVSNVKAQTNVLASFESKATISSTSRVYSEQEVKALLESKEVACINFKRKAYLSKGYIARFGNVKDFCNAKDAKNYGITRLDKTNLPISMRTK